MLTEKIESPTKTLGTLLEQVHQFFIPPYQRGYAWEEEQIEAFIDDVYELSQRKFESNDTDSHFFGSIVTVSRPDPSTDQIRYEIVDGQQRLTTTILLLSAICKAYQGICTVFRDSSDHALEAVAKKANTRAEEITTRYLTSAVYGETRHSIPKLESNKADNPVLQKIIDGQDVPKSGRDSHQLMISAHEMIRVGLVEKAVKSKSDPELQLRELDRLKDSVTKRSFLIHVIAEKKSSANRLFSVLNSRGKQIGPSDLLRADTLEALEGFPSQQDQAADIWDVLTSFGEESLNGFFLAYYPSKMGHRCKEAYYADYSENIFSELLSIDNSNKAENLVEFLQSLEAELGKYRSISEGSWPYPPTPGGNMTTPWDQARLSRLVKTIRHTLAIPLLLAAAENLSESDFANLVHTLELFAFRYKNICSGHTGAASKSYYSAASSMRKRNFAISDFKKTLSQLMQDSADDDTFRLKLSSLTYSKTSQRNNIKELLSTIDDYASWVQSGKKGVRKPTKSKIVSIEQLDIEHIYPQNPKVVDHSLEPLKHTLGNLTIWDQTDNRSNGNGSFDEKKLEYMHSSIAENRRIAGNQNWDEVELSKRAELVVDLATAVFTVD